VIRTNLWLLEELGEIPILSQLTAYDLFKSNKSPPISNQISPQHLRSDSNLFIVPLFFTFSSSSPPFLPYFPHPRSAAWVGGHCRVNRDCKVSRWTSFAKARPSTRHVGRKLPIWGNPLNRPDPPFPAGQRTTAGFVATQ